MVRDQASRTAMLMARAYALAEIDPERRRLMKEGEWEKVRCLLEGEQMLGRAGLRVSRWLESWALPGISLHYLARKRWIEERVRRALAGGAERLVVMGAGMDVLGWRLAEEGVDVAEVDHPATQAVKRRRMGEPPPKLSWMAADLGGEWEKEAAKPGGGRAVIVMEGLTMYFDEAQVKNLLEKAAGIFGKGSELVMTVMDEVGEGCWDFRGQHPAVSWWLKWRGEPFRWGMGKEKAAGWLAERGLEVKEAADDAELRREVLEPAGMGGRALAQGEYLIRAIIL